MSTALAMDLTRAPTESCVRRVRRRRDSAGGDGDEMGRRDSTSAAHVGVADPDAGLVARVAIGDADAAQRLVERHLSKMVAVGMRMLGDEAEAEDVAQEVFLRVWRHAGDWKPGRAKFETWMHRVAINLCYDRLRRVREVVTDSPPETADESPSAFDRVHGGDVAIRVQAALEKLPPRQRAAVTLCHYLVLSNIEAAAVLEVSVEAIESLLARARRALKSALAPEAQALMESVDGRRG